MVAQQRVRKCGLYYGSIIILYLKTSTMSILCPKDYICCNISLSTDPIQLSLKNSQQDKLQQYKQKNTPDMKIHFMSKQWPIHMYVLEHHSDIIWKGLVNKVDEQYSFSVKISGSQLLFDKILQSLYGESVIIKRCEVHQMYYLCKELQISELIDELRDDMLENFEEYELFPLLKFATEQKILDVMAICYETLQLEQFQPMRYNKSGLFICDPQLFRTIIKRHNCLKNQYAGVKYGLNQTQISNIVDQYCLFNGIQAKRKERFFADIENKENCTFFFMSSPRIDLFSTNASKRKITTCNNITSLSNLAEIRQPEEEQPFMKSKKIINLKDVNCVSFVDVCSVEKEPQQNGSISSRSSLSPMKVKRHGTFNQFDSQMSFSPTCRKSKKSQSPKCLRRPLSQISDIQTVITLNNLSLSLNNSLKSSSQIQEKAQQMVKRMKQKVKKSKERTSKIQRMENQLEEIYAELMCSKSRLEEVQRTVTHIEEVRESQEVERVAEKQRQKKIFETSIALDLSVSREFGNRTLHKQVLL